MGVWDTLVVGMTLIKLANAFEEVEQTRATRFIGAGGGVDSLPGHRQAKFIANVPRWIARLQGRDKSLVTSLLLDNMRSADAAGRHARVAGQVKLLRVLVDNGVAFDVDSPAAEAVETRLARPADQAPSAERLAQPPAAAPLATPQEIAAGYRGHAANLGPDCAPSAKTTDARVAAIHADVVGAFQEVAQRRSESLPAAQLEYIVWTFLQIEEDLGPHFLGRHLAYEAKKYLSEGLRDDYKRQLLVPARSGAAMAIAQQRPFVVADIGSVRPGRD